LGSYAKKSSGFLAPRNQNLQDFVGLRDSDIKLSRNRKMISGFCGRSTHHIKSHFPKGLLLWSKALLQKRHSLCWVMKHAWNFEAKELMKRTSW